jgi:DNA-binding transcriptional regulator YiaG
MPTGRANVRVNGAAIRAIRKAMCLTSGQCAEKIGVNESTWNKWERGVVRVSPRNFSKVVEALALDDRCAILAIPEAQ